jgi:gliding-associated putative ABC transporter substrate-binding component GldG
MLVILAAILLVNVFSQYFFFQYDFTEDKRYSLTEPTRHLLKNQDDIIFVKVLLEGEFPAGFKRLQRSVKELLDDYRSISPYIEYEFENPLDGSIAEINERMEVLRQDGIHGVPLQIDTKDGRTQKSIFPYAIFNFGKRKYVVNLLEPQTRGVSDQVWMNNSINLLEYKFSNAIQKLKQVDKPVILFTKGQGELITQQTARMENKLRQYYQVGHIDLDSVTQIKSEVDLLIVAKPTEAFSNQKQFMIDQYLMRGGKIIWMIDKLNINLDSINQNKFYIPEPYPLGLDDMWFKYGVRIMPNLVQDLECTRIPQVVGVQGDQPKIEKFKWFYHVLSSPVSDHPIVNNLDRINLYSPSSIDTIQTTTPVKKTILLTSSQYSRFQLSPARLTFDILQYQPEIERFNKPFQPLAVLVEGNFESYFKNKLTGDTKEMLENIGTSFTEESTLPGKMIFISDGDFAKNLYNADTDQISPIGFNKWENYTFIGNEDFITNAIEYMVDEEGVLTARTKKIRLRLIDEVKATEQDTYWRIVNIISPLILVLLFGFAFNFIRKRKYK